MNLVIGRAGTDKTNEILDRVRKDIESDEKTYLIVPEQFSYTFEKKITDSFSSVLNLQILSFTRLVEQILADSKYKNKTYLDDVSRTIILENILEKLSLRILRNKEKNLQVVSNTIEEFKKYDVKPTDLKQYLDIQKEKKETLSIIKLEEIYQIYTAYNNEIENKYLDIADREYEVLNIIEEELVFRGSKIYIDQFAKFTHAEYKLIEKMLKQADSVTIAITTDSIHRKSEYEVFSTTKNTISNLIQIAQDNGKKINIIEKEVNIKHGAEMKNLEIAMFEEKSILARETEETSEIDDNSANITLKVYKNLEDELEDVAENIMEDIIEKKYRYSDIAIVFNDLESKEELVRRTFSKYNIPIHLERTKRLEQNSIARYILELLEVISNKYSAESVFSFLKIGYTDFDIEDIYLLEKYVLRWDIKGSKWKSSWKNYDKIPDIDFDKIIKIKDSFVSFVESFKEKIGRSKSAKDISKEIYNLLETEQVFLKSIQSIDSLNIDETRKLELKASYIFSLNLIKESLDKIVSIKSDDVISYEKYFNIFNLVLRTMEIKQIPSINDAVHIVTTKTLNIEDIKSLYIISLTDELYPLLSSYKGLISDEEKLTLRSHSIKLSDTDLEKLSDDEYSMYSIFLIPSKSLHLSYHISSLEGEQKRPSIYVNKIKRRLKYLEEENRIKGLYKETIRIYSNKALIDKVLSKYLELLEGKEIADEWKYLIYVLQETSPEFLAIEKNILSKNIAPNLSIDVLEKLYTNNLNTSISRLEEYAKCPFSHYVKYTLGVQEEKLHEINPLNTGILLHDVIEEMVSLVQDGSISLEEINSKLSFFNEKEVFKLREENQEYKNTYKEVMDKIDNITLEILARKLQEDKYKMFMFSPKFELLTNKFKEQVKEATKAIINSLRMSDFTVLGNEINIDDKYSKSNFSLKNNRSVSIYGQIDRADILKKDNKTYLRIVDYKSSRFDLDENRINAGLQIQLLTYLDILAKEKQFEPSAALYFGLSKYVKSIGKKSDNEIRKALTNNMRMSGIVLADKDIVKAMDKSLKSGESDIIPVGIKMDGDFTAKSKIKDENEFKVLRKNIEKNIINMSENILQGDISIHPYKYNKEIACTYCPYKKICQFDNKKNRYRKIKIIEKENKE